MERKNAASGKITRKEFVRKAAIGASVVGAAAMGAVRAQGVPSATEVWPDSAPQAVINAVDAGGTVYFHSRTKEGVFQPYDLNAYPLTAPANPLSRFIQIGRLGKDVAIVGLNDGGIKGERPKIINGGAQQLVTPAKMRGVRLTVTNMEFFRPASGAGSVGATSIFVNNSAGTEITGCKFTVDGASPAQFQYIKFAIWLIFRKDMAYDPKVNPCSGPLVVKDNEFFVTGKNNPGGSTGAIGFGCFFDTNVPSYLVDDNYVEADGCGGGFGSMLGGCHGNGSNSVFSNNTVKTVGEPSDKVLFFIPSGSTLPFLATNVQVLHNDFSGAVATIAQIIVDGEVPRYVNVTAFSDSLFKNNVYGPVEPGGIAGFVMKGHSSSFVNESFIGNYAGGLPCLWLDEDSHDNSVVALKNGSNIQGMDLCYQIVNNGVNNIIPGFERCGNVLPEVIIRMREKECLRMGGTWNGTACTLPQSLSMEDIPIPQD